MTITTPLASSSSQSVSDKVLGYLDRGLALPGELYTDPDLFALEMRAIFARQWLYAGHVSELPSTGAYLVVEVGDESAIVARDRSGQLHGVLNVCRHRGARLVEDSCGSVRKFVCPYHQWAYSLDGTLVGAPRMPKDFDKSHYPLQQVHVAEWHGLVFVNFSLDPVEDLQSLLAGAADLMAPFDIASTRIAHTETYDVQANWKLVWENSQECYHCNANHPEFVKSFDNTAFASGDPTPERSFTDDRRAQGATFPLKEGAQSLTMTGQPACARLTGEFARGRAPYTAAAHLKPGFAAVFSPDYGIVFTDVPVAPDRTQVRVQWLVHTDAVEGDDYDVANLVRVWDQTNRQDWDLCRSVQKGVLSSGFTPGPLSLDESAVAGFYYSYARMLSAAGH